ncbi:MAG: hypothetical protein F6K30_01810 [Cyanothece sp. SIO2G6]|nr:hypothetical protein [Cyanothece sp. SIO2G6]
MSSSRYQSRVLQTIAQQTLKWRDRALKSLRQLRLTLTWSTQILLYPIYVALQSSRLVGKQFSQATQRLFPQLAAIFDPHAATLANPGQVPVLPESDRPIQTLLNAWERTKSEERKTKNSPTPQLPSSLTLRALATLFPEQTLVLVDTHNTIHDVLTPEQQQQLQQRIVVEMANYWRDRHEYIAFQIKQAHNPRFLPLPQERPTMLPPVRYVRRFIAWMQTSPLAIATNLFQESALVPTTLSNTSTARPAATDLESLPPDIWFDPDYHIAAALKLDPNHYGVIDAFRQSENPETEQGMISPISQSPQPETVASSPTQATSIDTTAELVAYEKHPLERVLGWVDQGMTWIETRIARVWDWLRDRF